jgi:four helix bundle protein
MDEKGLADHRDLVVWQRAMQLAGAIYRATAMFPRAEIFGLTSQLRRASVSVASNIPEGSARRTTADFLAFLHIARGSQAEIDTQLRLARDLGFVSDGVSADLLSLTDEVGRLLTAVIHGVRRRRAQ